MKDYLAAILFAFVAAPGMPADEAVFPSGARLSGTLEWHQSELRFRSANKTIPLKQLQHVRFSDAPCPVPRVPMTHQLLLGNDQSIAGELLEVKDAEVRFRLFTGQEVKCERKRLAGISQVAGWQVLEHTAFEQDDSRWKLAEGAHLSDRVAFSGKKCLALSKTATATRSTPGLTTGRLTFHCRQEGSATLQVQMDFRLGGKTQHLRWRTGDEKQAATSWRLVQINFGGGSWRTAVDDHVVAEESLPKGAVLAGMTFRVETAAGTCHIDDAILMRPADAKLPAPLPDFDTVCLSGGDRLFGRIVEADGSAVTLQSKLGRRTLPWTAVQTLLFAARLPGPAAADDIALWVNPGPGFAAQRLVGRVQARDDGAFLFVHGVLGNLEFERRSCRRLNVPPTE